MFKVMTGLGVDSRGKGWLLSSLLWAKQAVVTHGMQGEPRLLYLCSRT